MLYVKRRSRLTQKQNVRLMDITKEQLDEVSDDNRTKTIQDIVPNLSSSDREFLISGITPEEWLEAFGNHDDD